MNTTIYIVYVTHFSKVIQLYAFPNELDAQAKRLEQLQKWVNEDQFQQWVTENEITNITTETYDEYFLEIDDDAYVGLDEVILN
jgi:outer membrane receptor for monomeric catechols